MPHNPAQLGSAPTEINSRSSRLGGEGTALWLTYQNRRNLSSSLSSGTFFFVFFFSITMLLIFLAIEFILHLYLYFLLLPFTFLFNFASIGCLILLIVISTLHLLCVSFSPTMSLSFTISSLNKSRLLAWRLAVALSHYNSIRLFEAFHLQAHHPRKYLPSKATRNRLTQL